MGIFQRLKTAKGKWFYLGLVVILFLMIVGIAGKMIHHRFEERHGEYYGLSEYQTYFDLLYLENTVNAKFSSEQAKTLLPLVKKLPGGDKQSRIRLLKSIYEQLTPEQYYLLLTADRKTDSGELKEKWHRLKRELSRKWEHGRDQENIRQEILKAIVVKMMEDISLKIVSN